MKCLFVVGFVLLLSFCVDGSVALKGSARHHLLRMHENRSSQGFCTLDCSGVGSGGDWLLDLSGLGISVAFSKADAALAIINSKANMVAVLVNGFFGIFNISTGVGLLVNISNGLGTIISGIVSIKSQFIGAGVNIMAGIGSCVAAIVKSKAALVAGAIGAVFDIKKTILAFLGTSLELFLAGISSSFLIGLNLSVNFFTLLNGLFAFFISGAFNAAFGVFNLVGAIVAAKYAVLASAFTQLAAFVGNSVAIKSQLLYSMVYNLFYFMDSIIAGKIAAVQLVNTAWQFFASGGVLLFTVTTDGFIVMSDLVVGTIANVGSVISGLSYGGYVSVGSSSASASVSSGPSGAAASSSSSSSSASIGTSGTGSASVGSSSGSSSGASISGSLSSPLDLSLSSGSSSGASSGGSVSAGGSLSGGASSGSSSGTGLSLSVSG